MLAENPANIKKEKLNTPFVSVLTFLSVCPFSLPDSRLLHVLSEAAFLIGGNTLLRLADIPPPPAPPGLFNPPSILRKN